MDEKGEEFIEPEKGQEKLPPETEKETSPEKLEQVLERQSEQAANEVAGLGQEGRSLEDVLTKREAEGGDIDDFKRGEEEIEGKAKKEEEEYNDSFRTPGDIESYIRSQSEEGEESGFKEENREALSGERGEKEGGASDPAEEIKTKIESVSSSNISPDQKRAELDRLFSETDFNRPKAKELLGFFREADTKIKAEKEIEIDELMAEMKGEVESVSSSSDSPVQKKANLDALFSRYVDTLNKYQIDSNHPKAKELLDFIRETDSKIKEAEKGPAKEAKESEDSFKTPGDIESDIRSQSGEGDEGGVGEENKGDLSGKE